MKALGALLVLAALAALGLFLWPLIGGEKPDGLPPDELVYSRSQESATPLARGEAASSAGARAVAVAAPTPAVATPGAGDGQTIAEQVAAAQAAAAAAPQGPAGPLCDRQFDGRAGKPFAMPATRPLRRGDAAAGPSWTWVSLWAAWCKPCIEEMPELVKWAAERRASGQAVRTLFLSVDDDERQLQRFMQGQGAGIRSDFAWLADEGGRAALYAGLGVKNPPTLPVQILLDPAGKLRCVRVGSVGPADLATVPTVLGW